MSEDKPKRKPKHSPPSDAVYMNFSLLSANREDDPERRRKEDLRAKYPDVPPEQREVWERSDLELPQNHEWHNLISKARTAISKADSICANLLSPTQKMAPKQLNILLNNLRGTVHRLEDLMKELRWSYPLLNNNWYDIAVSDPLLQDEMPQLLENTPDRILIYTPNLPPNYNGTNSLYFLEFQGFLQTHRLCNFKKWHCDFIHVYDDKPDGIFDADNYFYKPIIDALARAIGSFDCTDWFSYSKYNLPSKTIRKGCYIQITNRDEKVGFFQEFEGRIKSAATKKK